MKAVGDLDLGAIKVGVLEQDIDPEGTMNTPSARVETVVKPIAAPIQSDIQAVEIGAYAPSISVDGVWTLSETDIGECPRTLFVLPARHIFQSGLLKGVRSLVAAEAGRHTPRFSWLDKLSGLDTK